MRILKSAAAVGALGLAFSLSAAPASAASVLSARCAKSGFQLNASITYANAGAQHIFTKLTWNIAGAVGSDNDVYFEFWKNGSPDHVLKVVKMNDVSRSGSVNLSFRRPVSDPIYVRGGAVFDTNHATDPVCKYVTRTI
ncbi:hypothetical protein ACIBEJ_24500 [Nonomuraea sp. NPDC050790]|uniref:hypothetical protein n=1 Tax=Nonomuraea sp. NPDC050790 TaxID=3364371 RepID=UPI00379F594A